MIIFLRNLIFLFFFFTSTSNSFSHESVVYIDLDYILKNSKNGASIISKLNKINDENIKKIKSQELQLKDDENELIKTKNVISEEIFNKKLNELKKKINLFKEENKKMRKILEETKKRELNNFFKKIEPIFSDYMEENSISLMLDKKNVFIGKTENDLTITLLEIIDKNIN